MLTGLPEASAAWLPGWSGHPIPPVGPGQLISTFRVEAGRRKAIHVLMIEDDPSIADMYRMQLEHDGYRVTVATTGEVGLGRISGDAPDIVLLDLLLPDRSGFEVLTSLNDRLPGHPPVVILSNYGEPSMMDRGRELGAIEYLVKSRVTPGDISHLIPGWLEQGRTQGGEES